MITISRTERVLISGQADLIDITEFQSEADAEKFLREHVPDLNDAHFKEIWAEPDTNFIYREMINRGVSAYLGTVVYEISVGNGICANIVKDIKTVNDSRGDGLTISQDQSNEEIAKILKKYDLDDDEEILEAKLGLEGLHAVRDAEAGIYPECAQQAMEEALTTNKSGEALKQ